MRKLILLSVALFGVALSPAQITVAGPVTFKTKLALTGNASGIAWSVTQFTSPGRVFCNKSVDVCTINLTSATNWANGGSGNGTVIGSGHRLAFGFNDHWDGTQVQRTLVSLMDCTAASLNGSGNCTTSINSWTCPGASVQGYGTNSSGTDSTDLCYVLSSVPGAQYVTYQRSGHSLSVENYGGLLAEFSSTGSSPALDGCGATSDNTVSFSKTMTALPITGSSEAIFQVFGSSQVSSVSSPWNANFYGGIPGTHFTETASVNTSSGVAPTYTLQSQAGAASSVCAFKQ